MQDISSWSVNKKRCKSCPFNDDGYIPARERIKLTVLSEASHICHITNSSLCRGSRDYQLVIFHRMGIIQEPTDKSWDEKRTELGC